MAWVIAKLLLDDKALPIIKPAISIRRSKGSDIIVEDMNVSRHHGQTKWRGDHYIYIDLKSEIGSFINNVFIELHELSSGDVVLLGKKRLLFIAEIPEVKLSNTKKQSKIVTFG